MESYVVVAGTRPEIIKIAPIIRKIKSCGKKLYFVHTGQHYDYSLSRQMILDLDLPEPDLSFRLRSYSPASQIAEIMKNLEKILAKSLPKGLVIVQGDTNSVLSASLAAVKCGSPLAHIEAGLRSFDWRMPEEHNRRMVDHISNYLFAPTTLAKQNLEHEKVFGRVFMTGNTVIDAVNQHMVIAENKSSRFEPRKFSEYAVATFHRSENVDDRKTLTNIVNGLIKSEMQMIIPLHPRTKKMLLHFELFDKLSRNKNIQITTPQGYLQFLLLLKNSRLIITDSGGIQEESTASSIFKKVVVLRRSTERQEAVRAGFAVVVDLKAEKIAREIIVQNSKKLKPLLKNPYGDGFASNRIMNILNRLRG